MSLAQPDLFGNEPRVNERGLTPRQEALYQLVRATPDGLQRDEAGALVHSMRVGRWHHGPDERCTFCARDGRAALRAAALKPWITGRRDGRWYPRDPADAVRPVKTTAEPTEAELAANPFAGL